MVLTHLTRVFNRVTFYPRIILSWLYRFLMAFIDRPHRVLDSSSTKGVNKI
jgi:hypothetical protein